MNRRSPRNTALKYSETLIIINNTEKCRECKAVRESDLHPISTYWGKEENGKRAEDKKGASCSGKLKSIGPALETSRSHTIEYRVSKDRSTETLGKRTESCASVRFCSEGRVIIIAHNIANYFFVWSARMKRILIKLTN